MGGPPSGRGTVGSGVTSVNGNRGSVDAGLRRRIAGEVTFRAFTPDDLGRIADLIRGMSSSSDDELRLRDKSAAYYRWMYYDNPAGPAFGYLAEHGERIVSSFAVAPKVMQVGGRRVRAGKTMDMFTDPDYQGMGLIKGCADRVFAAAGEAGIEGWYVTPSPNSYPIFKDRWGYREPFDLVYRARVLELEPVLNAIRPGLGRLGGPFDWIGAKLPRRAAPVPAGSSVTRLGRFDERADRLWDQVAPDYGIAVVRDAEYLNWRYVRNPDDYVAIGLEAGTDLRGIVVVKTTLRQGVTVGEIVDIVGPAFDREVISALLRLAVAECRRLGAALVETWAIRKTWFDRQYIRGGLAFRRARVPLLVSPDFSDPLTYDGDAWLLTQGDGNDV